ncbi:MAG: ABC-F family ATP-binding cassette domain-containing protein [Clostridia bacterium]|nr:ABC-F family ATP-binding cassette domain-containing protein [Clostridia bacterium]
MSILNCQNVSLSFPDKEVLRNITFSVEKGDKIGLIGSNGSGKTTLFRLITGALEPTDGKIFMSADLKLGFVEQHACGDSDVSVYDELLTVFAPLMEMERRLEEVHRKVELTDGKVPEYLHLQEELTTAFQSGGGLTYVSRAHSTLQGLGFTREEEALPVSALSGGQRTKLALGKLLLSEPELMLLDEPTNHLDITSTEWLEDFLSKYQGALLVVSHDRYFLDKVTSSTMELTACRLYSAPGSYSTYMKTKALRYETDKREYEKGMLEIKRIEKMIEQQKQFNQERNYVTIASKEKQIERIRASLPELPPREKEMRLRFSEIVRSGDEVLHAEGLSKAYDGKALFRDASLDLRRGDRVFLLGPNGCGKTTLLGVLLGKVTPDAGFVHFGQNVKVGYFEQTQREMMHDKTVLYEIYDEFPSLTVPEIRSLLAAFLFRGDEIEKNMRTLSGGERARVALLKLILRKPNFLILDEPTNHLDLASREILEEALASFEGTILCVSHDRYFVNRLATSVMSFRDGTISKIEGNYDAYLALLQAGPAGDKKPAAEKKPNAYQLRKETERAERLRVSRLKKIDARLNEIEAEKGAIEADLSTPETAADYEKVLRLTAAVGALDAERESLEEEWLTLNE